MKMQLDNMSVSTNESNDFVEIARWSMLDRMGPVVDRVMTLTHEETKRLRVMLNMLESGQWT